MRILGLILMAFAIVSSAGAIYIASLISTVPDAQGESATHAETIIVTSALIGGGLFVAGLVVFSLGTSRKAGRSRPKVAKDGRVTCPSCAEEYSTRKLRCPSCGEENELHWTPPRTRGVLDLSGPYRVVFIGIAVLFMLGLGALLLAMRR